MSVVVVVVVTDVVSKVVVEVLAPISYKSQKIANEHGWCDSSGNQSECVNTVLTRNGQM
jgi:hypothetical protein